MTSGGNNFNDFLKIY